VEGFRAYIRAYAPYSQLLFFLVQLRSVVLAPVPSNISAAAGGMLFGTWPAFALTFAAVWLGSVLVFLLARRLGRSFAERFVGRKVSEHVQELIRTKRDSFLALAFLFPFFPDDLLCMLAGLTGIPVGRFVLLVLLTRPWGLLFASALGGAAIRIPLHALVVIGLAGAAVFLLGLKYGDRAERWLLKQWYKQ
jgi:uncharacterized membrane protein YdjX (TVP38/TMEM64 family)